MIFARTRTWVCIGLLCCGGTPLSAQVPPVTEAKPLTQRPVYIEDSPAAQELVDEAMDLRDQGRTADAVQRLQRVIDEYPFKLMPTREGTYTDAVLWVRTQLLADQRLLDVYRSLFGPTAAREVTLAMPTATNPIDIEKLHDVLTRHTLTPAGLDAGLALGAYHLERAEGRDAWSVLNELVDHPDLPDHPGRYHFQRALSAMLLSDAAAYQAHRQILQALPDPSYLAELDALANRTHPPLRFQHDSATPSPPASNLPDTLDTPLWEAKYAQGFSEILSNRSSFRGVPPGVSLLRVIPAADADRVYLNLGDKLTAYDRASGWHLWDVPDQAASQADTIQMMTRQMMTEPRGVLISSGRVFSLLGWMNPRQNLPMLAPGGVSLVGIDAQAGQEIWRVKPWELDPALEKASFDGTPIGSDGRVYTLVKRVQVSGLHDLYLTAVSEADGQLIWRRHLSSSSAQGNYNTGPLARMVLHRGRVYVTDNRGTICALDGRTGTMRWLTILPTVVPNSPRGRRVVTPIKDIPPPVIVQAGMIVPPIIASGSHVLLDTQTGQVLRDLSEESWQNIQAAYPAGKNILTLGAQVTYFDGATLKPLWHTPLNPAQYGTVQGRPAVDLRMESSSTSANSPQSQTQGVIVLNTDRRLISLSLTDGKILADAPITSPGNVILAPGQVLIAGAESLKGYTDWPTAHDQLTSRATLSPPDPQPGLALARLALRTRRDSAVLEGIDLAMASLDVPLSTTEQQDARQRSVFGPLREIIDPTSGAGIDLRGELLNRMATSTATPRQEAAYQLTRGLYLQERGQPTRAVEHFQAVLADKSLSAELYTQGRASIRAGLQAQRLIKSLIQAHGQEVYRDYDLLAQHELEQLTARGASEAQRYADLADRYPLAASANNARIYATDLFHEQGQASAALRQLQTVYLNTDSIETRSMSAGRITRMYLQQDRPDLARSWLRRVNREHADLVLARGDQPVSISSWLSELTAQLSVDRQLPRIDLPLSTPRLIPGRPMLAPLATGPSPRNKILMRDDQSIWMLSSQGFSELWNQPLPAPDARLLLMDDRQVIWWSQETAQLGGINTQTGKTLWPQIDFAAALNQAGPSNRRMEHRTRPQMEFVQILGGAGLRNPRINNIRVNPGMNPGVNPGANPGAGTPLSAIDLTSIILADHQGRIVCIDRHTGQVRWRTVSTSDNLTALTIGDGLVAISGANWADTQVQHGIITLLDILTGEPLELQIQSKEIPTWLGFADNGLLVMAANNILTAYDPATARTQWSHQLPRQATVRHIWLGRRLLIASTYQQQVGSALVMDISSGAVVNQVAIRSTAGQANSFDAIQTQTQWQVFTPMQAVALNPSGQTRWADAICAPIGHMLIQLIGEQYVCFISQTGTQKILTLPQANVPGRLELEQAIQPMIAAGQLRVQAGGYRLYLLNRNTGTIRTDTPLPSLPGPIDPAASAFLDGALLLGVGDQTLLIQHKTPPD